MHPSLGGPASLKIVRQLAAYLLRRAADLLVPLVVDKKTQAAREAGSGVDRIAAAFSLLDEDARGYVLVQVRDDSPNPPYVDARISVADSEWPGLAATLDSIAHEAVHAAR